MKQNLNSIKDRRKMTINVNLVDV